jgi:NADH-quinone oxidoreductase subunit L
LISTLAISGVPFLSGFFSKDEILWWAFGSSRGHWMLWVAGALAAAMTAFYMFRLVFMTFFGEQRTDARAKDHIPESPFTITIPLMVLAVLAAVGGYIGVPALLGGANHFHHFLEPVFGAAIKANNIAAHGSHALEFGLMGVSIGIAVVGIFAAYIMYIKRPELPGKFVAAFSGLHRTVFNKWYVDEIYDALFINSTKKLGTFLWKIVDVLIIDGIVNGFGALFKLLARVIRFPQTGLVHNYAMTMVIGVVVIVAYYVVN